MSQISHECGHINNECLESLGNLNCKSTKAQNPTDKAVIFLLTSGQSLSQESTGATIGNCKDIVENLHLTQENEEKHNALSLAINNAEPSSNCLTSIKMF